MYHWVLRCVIALLLAGATAQAQVFDPCTFRGKKPRKERYWKFAVDVECRGGQPALFSVYDFQGRELWRAEIKDKKFHGKSFVQVCAAADCRRSADLTYRDGALDGPATLVGSDGARSVVRYKNGVLDGPFTVTRGAKVVRGNVSDGVFTVNDPDGTFRADDLVADFGNLTQLYRELLDYRYAKSGADVIQYNLFGYLFVRRQDRDSTVYRMGLREHFAPWTGIGARYERGKVKEEVRYKGGIELARRSTESGSEWKETPQYVAPPFRPNHMFLTLGLGYGTSGRFNADIAVVPMSIKDIGGGGFGVMAGIYNDTEPYYTAGGVIGAIAMFFTGYVSVGARFDDESVFPDATVGFGFAGLMLYLRGAPPQTTLGKPLELGITAKIPLLGI